MTTIADNARIPRPDASPDAHGWPSIADVIKAADWIIDLGPEGGDQGGEVVAYGTPEQVMRSRKSYTGRLLAKVLRKRLKKKSA